MSQDNRTLHARSSPPTTNPPMSPFPSTPSPSRPRSTTRFGVLGTGRITRRLVADLQSTESVSVTAIASRNEKRGRWYADRYGIASGVCGYESLVRREDVDAVYVALPPALHAEWSLAAAEHGKHVLCEKPLATTAAEAQKIADACRRADVRWLDATGWLHHRRTAAIAEILQQSKLGTLGHLSASVSFFEPFQSGEHRLDRELGGGCLLDLGWYVAGLARFAAGKNPSSVFADAVLRDGIPHRLTAMLWWQDQLTATLSCGYDTATRKWFEIAGSQASLVCDDFTRPWADKPARFWVHHASGAVDQERFEDHQEHAMMTKLIGDQPLDSWQRQALDTQAILDAIAESIRSGAKTELRCQEATP